jgi:hypothetical protein
MTDIEMIHQWIGATQFENRAYSIIYNRQRVSRSQDAFTNMAKMSPAYYQLDIGIDGYPVFQSTGSTIEEVQSEAVKWINNKESNKG